MTALSEKQFSVDDILNEYSKKREELRKPKQGFDVDEFLKETKQKSNNDLNFSYKGTDSDNINSYIPPKKSVMYEPEQLNNPLNKAENATTQKNTDLVRSSVATIERPSEPVKTKNPPQQSLLNKNADNYSSRSVNGFGTADKNEAAEIKPISKSTGNTEIINNLLKLKRERVINKTSELIPVTRKNINDITLDIKAKIIPKTEQISLPEDANEDERSAYLAQQRSKKIKDFVLQDIDNDLPEDEQTDDDAGFSDYRTIEDAPAVHKSIKALKGTLAVRLIVLLVTFIVSTYIVLANDFSIPIVSMLNRAANPVSYLFVTTIIGLIAAFTSYSVISNGLKNLFTLKADSDSLCAVAMVTSLISSTAMLSNYDLFQRNVLHIYIPVVIGALLFNTIGKLLIVKRTERNCDLVASDGDKYAIFSVEDENVASKLTKGALTDFPNLVSIKKTEFVKDFLKNSYSEDISDKYCKIAVPVIFLVSIIAAALSVIFTNETKTGMGLALIALANLTGTISLCSSFAIPLTVNIPMSKSSKSYLESSAALIGYSAVDEFKDTNSVMVNATALFPEGAVDFVNLKQLSSTTIEEGILVAASLASHANSLLKAPFYKMLKGKTEMLYPVDSYVYEDSLGISGWIENKRVLLGNRELMENHSIEGLPSIQKERKYAQNNGSVVYLSISGEVTTLFIVKARASIGITKWLHELERLNITVVIHCVDSFISLNYLSELFDVSPECFKLLPFRCHKDFDEQTSYVPSIDSSLLCSGRFQSLALVVSGAKRLYKTAFCGLGFMMISAIAGGLIAIVMSMLASFGELTCMKVLLYNLAWLALTVTVVGSRK